MFDGFHAPAGGTRAEGIVAKRHLRENIVQAVAVGRYSIAISSRMVAIVLILSVTRSRRLRQDLAHTETRTVKITANDPPELGACLYR